MRKFFVLALVFVFVMAVASVAVANEDTWNWDNSAAGGEDGSTYNVVDPATQTPHGSYATTGDECEICHSPHNAGDGTSSYKLLRATDVGSACDYCHAAGGAAEDPYLVYLDGGGADLDKTDLNGHEIEAFSGGVPDDVDGAPTTELDGVLGCFDCHSVHGSDTMTATPFGTSTNGLTVGAGNQLPTFAILKADPGNSIVDPDGAANIDEYCDSCHTNNYVTIVNSVSHYMGTADDALSTGGADELSVNDSDHCSSCHRDNTTGDEYIWPHNSSGEALMDWTDITSAPVTRDTMDAACISCHDEVGESGGY